MIYLSLLHGKDILNIEKAIPIPIDKLFDFPNHPFKVENDKEMENMVETVKSGGIINPLVVRQREDGNYEIISGHRRKKASQLANLKEVPCIIRKLDDDEATIIMVDSNLQREQILPSERAFAYKMKLDAIKRQGERNDLTSTQVVQKLSVEVVADEMGESREKIRRYVRLTYLTEELLELVDNQYLKLKDKLQMSLAPAVEISYLTKNEQDIRRKAKPKGTSKSSRRRITTILSKRSSISRAKKKIYNTLREKNIRTRRKAKTKEIGICKITYYNKNKLYICFFYSPSLQSTP